MEKQVKTTPIKLTFKPGVGIILLIALMIFGLTVTSVVTLLLQKIDNPAAIIRISAVLQDMLVFILPAIATAMLATRLPAKLLGLDTLPSGKLILIAIVTLLFSMPAMNWLVEWNSSISLPDSLSHIEKYMRELEKAAEGSINMLFGNSSIGSLIISVLIIGVLAGFSEELFFRGALQRLLGIAMNKHVAIWITAFIFSAIHLQFYGFFPRFLLGALFGYFFYWSGSLIVPIVAHIFNNSLVVVIKWLQERGSISTEIETFGSNYTAMDIVAVIISVIVTIIAITYFRRLSECSR